MSDIDRFRLLALVGFVFSSVAFFLNEKTFGEEHQIIIGVCAAIGLLTSGYGIVVYGGLARGLSTFEAWIGLIAGILVLYGVVSGLIYDTLLSKQIMNSLDNNTQEVVSALSRYRDEHNVCPESLSELYPDYLTSDDLFIDKGIDAYNYHVANDKSTCSVSRRVSDTP